MTYFATKFDSKLSEVIGSVCADHMWADETSGEVDSPTGYFARITLMREGACDVIREFDTIDSDPWRAGSRTVRWSLDVRSQEMVGFWLITGDSQGFVYVTRYETESDLRYAYDELEQAYSEWLTASSEDENEF